ncbi:MAG: glycerophosphodiester phosphodiesterase [Dehalococcoidia bacterium]|nr:MAG: glycerophosphodiester phosphodiesterase [Dehalococcoidia bacterium]
MSRNGGRPIRIAHAYGNRRDKIEAAASAEIDFLEADLWYRASQVWVRHERRLGCLPILFDRRPQGVDSVGPWALTVFPRHYVRLDINPLRLAELLERTQGRCGLLLDLKGSYGGDGARAYAQTLARILAQAQPATGGVIVCGGTEVLDRVREAAPHLDVRYSIEKQRHWQDFLRRLEADGPIRGVSMAREFLSDEIVEFLEGRGLQVFCWTVDDAAEARRLLALGVDGIISNNIPLLEQLGSE